MRRNSSLPVYKHVEVTQELVQTILDYENQIIKNSILSDYLKDRGGVDWEAVHDSELYPPEIISAAVRELKKECQGKPVRLDESLVENIHNAIQWVYIKNLLLEEVSGEPDTASGFHNRANAYGQLGDIDKAIEDYTVAIELDPTNPLFYLSRARCLFVKENDTQSALTDVESALALARDKKHPEWLSMMLLRSKILKTLGRMDETVRSLEQCTDVLRHLVENVESDTKGWGSVGEHQSTNIVFVAEVLDECLELCKLLAEEIPENSDPFQRLRRVRCGLTEIGNLI
ncbi:MAG: tetratricopeptide repeat protein [Bacteroidota bacterium]